MVNSKKKGKSFERAAALIISQLTGQIYRRVPNSGAMATAKQAEGNLYEGDLFCEQGSPYTIECKITGKYLDLRAIVAGTSPIWKWWVQAKRQANGRQPVLLFRYRASPIFALTTEAGDFKKYLTEGIGIVRDEELVLGRLEAKS